LHLPTEGVSGFVASAFTGNFIGGAIDDGLNLGATNLGGEVFSAGAMAAAEKGAGRIANYTFTVAAAGSVATRTATSRTAASFSATATVPGRLAGRAVGVVSGLLTGRAVYDVLTAAGSAYLCSKDGY
jgi:hypothetical protein